MSGWKEHTAQIPQLYSFQSIRFRICQISGLRIPFQVGTAFKRPIRNVILANRVRKIGDVEGHLGSQLILKMAASSLLTTSFGSARYPRAAACLWPGPSIHFRKPVIAFRFRSSAI